MRGKNMRAAISGGFFMTHSDFADAYVRGYSKTVRFLLSAGVPPDAADDAAQAGWARGWEKRAQLKEPDKILGWIKRISLNEFRNALRRERATEELGDRACPATAGPDALDAQRGLDRCTPEEQELLQSYYVEGYTSRELGRRNRCSPVAIRVRVLRARRRFLKAMDVPSDARGRSNLTRDERAAA